MFNLKSDYSPTGDQPEAISQLISGINDNQKFQTLKGVTGSGKTFTVANVIRDVNKPTLVLAHNKTLAAQLYSEFKQFFPNNAVEYFVSYYYYYQPEAYLPVSGTYIEKDLSINKYIVVRSDKTQIEWVNGIDIGKPEHEVINWIDECTYRLTYDSTKSKLDDDPLINPLF